MIQRAHLSLALPLVLMIVPMLGCGDDDDGPPAAGSGGSGGSNGGSGGTSGNSGGSGGSGAPLEEGSTCASDRECATNLECMHMEVNDNDVGVCARPCSDDSECNGDRCGSPYTQLAQDAHCINLEQEQFGDCGPGYTAVCDDDRVCLFFPDVTIGVCVNLCDSDTDSDAGIPPGTPISECQPPQACIADIVAAGPSVTVGVCGTNAGRNDPCGIEIGSFCADADICAPDDPEADESESHCREDCSTSGTCVTGTCTSVSNVAGQVAFRYCKH